VTSKSYLDFGGDSSYVRVRLGLQLFWLRFALFECSLLHIAL